MHLSHRVSCILLAALLCVPASATDDAAAPTPPVAPACAAPGPDRGANHACAVTFARQFDLERAAGHDDLALAAMARAETFAPDDLRFAMARASLALKIKGQLSPAGIEAAAPATPDDVGLALLHGELLLARRMFDGVVADADRVVALRPGAPLGYEMRATANVGKNDFDAARGDVDTALRLDPRSADTLRLRAILRNNAGDRDGALADYQAAHVLQPKREDPFAIGLTQFMQRQFQDSAATLARTPPPAPEGTYWLMWRYLALARVVGVERASGSLGPGTAPGTSPPWPAPVVDFYLGGIDAAALLKAAQAAQASADLSQVCEAHFYMAEDAVLRRRGEATELFKAATRECPRNFHEFEAAQAELAAASAAGGAPTAH